MGVEVLRTGFEAGIRFPVDIDGISGSESPSGFSRGKKKPYRPYKQKKENDGIDFFHTQNPRLLKVKTVTRNQRRIFVVIDNSYSDLFYPGIDWLPQAVVSIIFIMGYLKLS